MRTNYEGKGTVLANGLIRVDDAAALPRGRVRVFVEPEKPASTHSIFDIKAPPGPGRSTEELLAELRALRDEWDRPWYHGDRNDKEGESTWTQVP